MGLPPPDEEPLLPVRRAEMEKFFTTERYLPNAAERSDGTRARERERAGERDRAGGKERERAGARAGARAGERVRFRVRTRVRARGKCHLKWAEWQEEVA